MMCEIQILVQFNLISTNQDTELLLKSITRDRTLLLDNQCQLVSLDTEVIPATMASDLEIPAVVLIADHQAQAQVLQDHPEVLEDNL